MFGGFQHDIAGGQGNLIISSLKSPNYDPAAGTGWAINKDGSATFYSVSLPNVGAGTKVTFASTAPLSPNVGDVWYNTADGLEASVCTSTAPVTWTPYQISSGAIAPQGIAPSNLASSITSRSLGGITTTVGTTPPATGNTAGDIFINSSTGQFSQWSGSAWTAITFNASNVLQAGTVTAAQINAASIAAAVVTAANVNALNLNAVNITGGTISGASIIGTGSANEFLAYNGTPAAGNLALSVSPVSGTDGHGNTVQSGFVLYNGSTTASQQFIAGFDSSSEPGITLIPPGLTHFTKGTGSAPLMVGRAVSQGTASETMYLFLQSGAGNSVPNNPAAISVVGEANDSSHNPYILLEMSGNGYYYFDNTVAIAAAPVSANNPANAVGVLSEESWHAFNPLTSGYSVPSGGYAEYKLYPDNTVGLRAYIQIAANSGPGTTAVQINQTALPAAYRPLKTHWASVAGGVLAIASGSNDWNAQVSLDSSGAIKLAGLASAYASAMNVFFNVRIPLD